MLIWDVHFEGFYIPIISVTVFAPPFVFNNIHVFVSEISDSDSDFDFEKKYGNGNGRGGFHPFPSRFHPYIYTLESDI